MRKFIYRTTIPVFTIFALAPVFHSMGENSSQSNQWSSVPPGRSEWSMERYGVTLRVDLPDPQLGYYRELRYDGAAMVSLAEWKGRQFFTRFRPNEPFTTHQGAGTAEEFDPNSPATYAGASVGGDFVKIGIGVLRRTSERDYWNGSKYPVIQRFAWEVYARNGEMHFKQSGALQSFGYRLEKRILIIPDGFEIRRLLTNTGNEQLETVHYGHNFILINERPVGRGYKVEMPADLPPDLSEKFPDLQLLSPRSLGFNIEMVENPGLLTLPFLATENQSTRFGVRYGRTEIQIYNQQNIRSVALFFAPNTISPEPFTAISLSPGESHEWSTRYIFSEASP